MSEELVEMRSHIVNLINRLTGMEVALDTFLEKYISEMPEEERVPWKDDFNDKFKTKMDTVNAELQRRATQMREEIETDVVKEDLIVTPDGQPASSVTG